jgi:hypothetical protein
MAIGSGSSLVVYLASIIGVPFVVRDRRVVAVALWAQSQNVALTYLQFHDVATAAEVTAGRVPQYILPLLVGGVTVLDGHHVGLEGIAFNNGLVLALSSTALTYTSVVAASGSWVQLMVK